MERRAFLGSLTGPMIAACAVCMGACSKSADGGSSTPAPTANFTVDLATQITSIGSSVAVNGVLIARLAAGNIPSSFVAVQQACTHQGSSINFVPSSNSFLCPNHGAQFNTAGANTGGQQTSALKVYAISIAGTTMTITG
jgi:cytochrome b6-f complex iron-sulfur subunit